MSPRVSSAFDLLSIPTLSNSGILPQPQKHPPLIFGVRNPKALSQYLSTLVAHQPQPRPYPPKLYLIILGKIPHIIFQSSPRPQTQLSGSPLWPAAISQWKFPLLTSLKWDGICERVLQTLYLLHYHARIPCHPPPSFSSSIQCRN